MQLARILALAALVAISGCESGDDARRKEAANNLKQMGLALEAYQGTNTRPEAKVGSATSDEAPETETPQGDGRERRAEKVSNLTGKVAEFHWSPDGEIDGITLWDGTEVRFPPTSGEKVAATVSAGDRVSISGWMHAGESEIHAATITHIGSDRSVEVDEPPPNTPE